MGFTDEQINIVLDVDRWQETKALAWSKHCTQRNSNPVISFCHKKCNEITQHRILSTGSYTDGPDNVGDNDLFAHVQA